ncbi:MAG: ribosome silencing factor [Pseudomonadota bacterium]
MSDQERPDHIVSLVEAALDELKAQEVQVLDVSKLTSITDRMIIASGRSNRHVKSMAEDVVRKAKEHNIDVLGSEGEQDGEWVLIDLAFVVVHLMLPRVRDFYKLEKLWGLEGGSEPVAAT